VCVLRLRRPSSGRSKLFAATCRHVVYPTRHISDDPIDRLAVQCGSPSRMARICSIKSIALARSSAFSILRCSNAFCSSFPEGRRAGLLLLRRNDNTSRGLFPGRRDMPVPPCQIAVSSPLRTMSGARVRARTPSQYVLRFSLDQLPLWCDAAKSFLLWLRRYGLRTGGA
jgi:hypothetical protein